MMSQPSRRPSWTGFPVQPLAYGGALLLALAAQALIDARQGGWAVLLLVAAAGVVFVVAGRHQVIEQGVAPAEQRPMQRPQVALALPGLALALASYRLFGPNTFTLSGTLVWLAGTALLWYALDDGPPPRRQLVALRERLAGGITISWPVVAVLGLTLVGAGLRLYQIDRIPAELGTDTPLKIQIVRGILAGERPIFSLVYPGREPLFFYLVALAAPLFGDGDLAVKATSALCGVVTIPVVYRLAASWFGRPAGLLAAGWLALSPWHVILSRTGYRAILIPLVVALTMLALRAALARGRRRDFMALGLVVGVGVYTYTAYQAVPLALALAWAVTLPGRWRASAGRAPLVRLVAVAGPGWLLAAVMALALLVPTLRLLASPEGQVFYQRSSTRITGSEVPLPDDLGRVLVHNALNSLGMFNVRGDGTFVTNVPGLRHMGAISGALFMLGAVLALTRARRDVYWLTITFLLVMQLPSAAAITFPVEVPSAQRGAGAMTPAMLLAALPLALIWQAVSHGDDARLRHVGLALLVAGLLALEGLATSRTYFGEYPKNLPYDSANWPITTVMAGEVNNYWPTGPVYLLIAPYWLDGNALRAQLHHPDQYVEVPELTAELLASLPPDVMFFIHPDDLSQVMFIRSYYPDTVAVPRHTPRGTIAYYSVYASRSSQAGSGEMARYHPDGHQAGYPGGSLPR